MSARISIDEIVAADGSGPVDFPFGATGVTDALAAATIAAAVAAVPHSGSPTFDQVVDWLSGRRYHVRGFGAIPTLSDSTTKAVNAAAFLSAIAAATAAGGGQVYIDNRYYLPKYVLASAAHNVTFKSDDGRGVLVYPSDDIGVATDGTADTLSKARSAIYLLNSNNVRFEGVTFEGSAASSDLTVNVGGGIYARGCTDLKLDHCTNNFGFSLLQQDATATDVGARLTACTSYGARGNCTVGYDAVFTACRFELPITSTYDRVDATHGSSHAIYLFAGRRHTIVQGCTFKNIRMQGVKVSGSSLPIRGVSITGNDFIDCGGGVEFGADDQQEHSGLILTGNNFYDCGTNKTGWTEAQAVHVLGAKSVKIEGNHFFYTRDSIAAVAAVKGIFVSRYTATSCPVESVSIKNNTFQAILTTTWTATTAYNIVNSFVHPVVKNGLHYSATIAGTSGGAEPTWPTTEGATVVDGTVTWRCRGLGDATQPALIVTQVIYVAEVGAGATNAGTVTITGNDIANVGGTGIDARRNVGLVVDGNTFTNVGTAIALQGNRVPQITRNTLVPGAFTSSNAQIRLVIDSFPIIHGNVTSGRLLGAPGQSWTVSDSGGSAAVDFPLQGTHGRALTTAGQPEIVMAYGDGWLDGDTVNLSGTTFTYKLVAPGAGQFNTAATLTALLDALGNIVATDYGAGFATPVVTGHIRVRWLAAIATANLFFIRVTAVNPTAGVMLRNGTAGTVLDCNSRGEGLTATRTVIWSPLAHISATVGFIPDNAAAATLLAANAPYVVGRSVNDSGANLVIEHGAVAGGEEFRWNLSS